MLECQTLFSGIFRVGRFPFANINYIHNNAIVLTLCVIVCTIYIHNNVMVLTLHMIIC